MMPVILYTDALIFLLIAVCIASAWYIRRRPHLALPWRRVAKSSTAMVSLLVLGLFLAVGLLDSLHFRPALPEKSNGQAVYSPEVVSVFDALAGGLRTHTEKTYSAPLASSLYNMESIEATDGKVMRGYPRLKFGGAHLADPARDWAGDVATRVALGVAGGLAVGALIIAAILSFPRKRESSETENPRSGQNHGVAPLRGTNQKGWMAIPRNFAILARFPAFSGMSVGGPLRALLITTFILSACIGVIVALASGYHVFGTDKVGQDVLYLALKSIRTGLVIGTVTTLVMLPFAIMLGVAAGYLRGWVDDAIQYIYTVLNSVPSVLLIAAAVLMVQVVIEMHADWFSTAAQRADVRLLALCAVLGVTSWTGLCRLLRGEAMKLREMEYIQAAQAFGVSSLRIMTRHILPNVMHIVLISVVMDFSGLVLAEAVLSYIGVGVDPSTVSFGNMINNARLELGREPVVWWSLISAFTFMLALVLAANLFADAVRDAFDPRLNRTEA
jgi:peptide/nickel transport system permease protein